MNSHEISKKEFIIGVLTSVCLPNLCDKWVQKL